MAFCGTAVTFPPMRQPFAHHVPGALMAGLFVTLLLLHGCSPPEACAAEPAYGGLGNDEVWVTLADARDRATSSGEAAVPLAPARDEVLAAQAGPPTFSWSSTLKISSVARAPTSLHRRGHGGSVLSSWMASASSLLVPAARAHLPPVSSDVYLVDIAVPGAACPLSIVTSELSHTLDDATWDALKEASGADLTLVITSAYLASGRISEGPFRSQVIPFRVE